jgi:membrane carboxypeptidase/penicillin-binding protein PbpC
MGMLDGGGKGFPAVERTREVPVVKGYSGLSIVSPSEGMEVFLEGEGKVKLEAAGGVGERRWWFVDGALVGEGVGVIWWEAKVGGHEVRVMDEGGGVRRVRVRVR